MAESISLAIELQLAVMPLSTNATRSSPETATQLSFNSNSDIDAGSDSSARSSFFVASTTRTSFVLWQQAPCQAFEQSESSAEVDWLLNGEAKPKSCPLLSS